MVYVVDEGSVFDAPLEKIWRYLQTPPDVHNHPDNQNLEMEMQQDGSVHLSFDNAAPDGSKFRNKIKLVMLPPVGFTSEYIEGPMTGSKSMQYYNQMGNRTGVTVVGEFVSKTVPENQIKPLVTSNLERVFKEDNANLQKFQ
ncbi:MAG: hypothetical protein ACHQ1H_01970 [Nitrososphaerales archaeon]